MADSNDSTQKVSGDFPADRTSDLAPNVNAELEKQEDEKVKSEDKTFAGPGRLDLGERLAGEAVEERSPGGGNIEIVETDVDPADEPKGVRSVVSHPQEDKSDNGKVYSDPRVNPRDTNAPDAGLTPDGIRIAE